MIKFKIDLETAALIVLVIISMIFTVADYPETLALYNKGVISSSKWMMMRISLPLALIMFLVVVIVRCVRIER